MKYFVIAMEDYFTLSKVMTMLREFTIGVVGTARFHSGRPGKIFKEIDDRKINFN